MKCHYRVITYLKLEDRYVSLQVGLKGEDLSLHTLSGSSSVEWVQGSLLAQKQPLTWYKVITLQIAQLTPFNLSLIISIATQVNS